ncbi:tropomyosin [Coprinopsis sp. MPI-PUGE-AT-0042]|nr:tropomyosin [Coprinopsis sp. MPI-PUGE-AT-0042]
MAADRVRQALDGLARENDAIIARAEAIEDKAKKLEQLLLEKEQDNNSLCFRLERAEGEVTKNQTQLNQARQHSLEGETTLKDASSKQKKIELLKEELDKVEQNLRETAEKLRQVDAKAEQLERQVLHADTEKEQMEARYQDLADRYKKSQHELEELEKSLDGL